MVPARGPENNVLICCLLCHLCYAIFALPSLHCNFCSGPLKNDFVTGAGFSCTCYRISSPGFHYFSSLLMLLMLPMLPDNQPYSFEQIGIHAFALLFIASDATDATDAT